MLRLYISIWNNFKFKTLYIRPERIMFYMYNFWGMLLIFSKHNFLYSAVNFFRKKSTYSFFRDFSLITYIFWKFYYNNRPRINTYAPTYFFTFGLMQSSLKLPTRSLTRRTLKLVITLWYRVVFTPSVAWVFNYYSSIIFFIQQLLKGYSFKNLIFFLPHHFSYFYKYKKYRSIKKWVKKGFYPNHLF